MPVVFFAFCGAKREQSFTGSTPVAPVVRSFLGISLRDSIDFIRWQLTLANDSYHLKCNYGVGKPNTSGFINGGKHIEVSGELKHEDRQYKLINKDRTLTLAEVNNNLLHLTDSKNHLLKGTGGWSYTLNNLDPVLSNQTSWKGQPVVMEDSTSFVGRTPCGVAGFGERKECYKLKWAIVFYRGAQRTTGKYRVWGSPWHKEGGRKGLWKTVEEKDHHVFYVLDDEKGVEFARLLALDADILAFTDIKGNLLVGNSDFSYTLNKRW